MPDDYELWSAGIPCAELRYASAALSSAITGQRDQVQVPSEKLTTDKDIRQLRKLLNARADLDIWFAKVGLFLNRQCATAQPGPFPSVSPSELASGLFDLYLPPPLLCSLNEFLASVTQDTTKNLRKLLENPDAFFKEVLTNDLNSAESTCFAAFRRLAERQGWYVGDEMPSTPSTERLQHEVTESICFDGTSGKRLQALRHLAATTFGEQYRSLVTMLCAMAPGDSPTEKLNLMNEVIRHQARERTDWKLRHARDSRKDEVKRGHFMSHLATVLGYLDQFCCIGTQRNSRRGEVRHPITLSNFGEFLREPELRGAHGELHALSDPNLWMLLHRVIERDPAILGIEEEAFKGTPFSSRQVGRIIGVGSSPSEAVRVCQMIPTFQHATEDLRIARLQDEGVELRDQEEREAARQWGTTRRRARYSGTIREDEEYTMHAHRPELRFLDPEPSRWRDEVTQLDCIAAPRTGDDAELLAALASSIQKKEARNPVLAIEPEALTLRLYDPRRLASEPDGQKAFLSSIRRLRLNLDAPGNVPLRRSLWMALHSHEPVLDIPQQWLNDLTLREVQSLLALELFSQTEVEWNGGISSIFPLMETASLSERARGRLNNHFCSAAKGIPRSWLIRAAETRIGTNLGPHEFEDVVMEPLRKAVLSHYGLRGNKHAVLINGNATEAFHHLYTYLWQSERGGIIRTNQEYALIDQYPESQGYKVHVVDTEHKGKLKTADELLSDIRQAEVGKTGMIVLSTRSRYGNVICMGNDDDPNIEIEKVLDGLAESHPNIFIVLDDCQGMFRSKPINLSKHPNTCVITNFSKGMACGGCGCVIVPASIQEKVGRPFAFRESTIPDPKYLLASAYALRYANGNLSQRSMDDNFGAQAFDNVLTKDIRHLQRLTDLFIQGLEPKAKGMNRFRVVDPTHRSPQHYFGIVSFRPEDENGRHIAVLEQAILQAEVQVNLLGDHRSGKPVFRVSFDARQGLECVQSLVETLHMAYDSCRGPQRGTRKKSSKD